MAIIKGDNVTAKGLLNCTNPKVDLNQSLNRDKMSPLLRAVQTRNVETVEALLQAGADATLATTSGVTAISHAACSGYEDLVKILLEHNPALIYQTLPTGENARDLAVENKHKIIVQILDNTQANLDKLGDAITILNGNN